MPELPEVETTRRGIAPWVEGQKVTAVVVRQPSLRWPVPANLHKLLQGQLVHTVERRGKYLLLATRKGTVLIHLGMSGSLRLVTTTDDIRKHDHVDIGLGNGKILRFHDPRRFGCILWHGGKIEEHPLLAELGPEPLSEKFTSGYLFVKSRKRMTPVKSFIMDSHVIVGVGNIYANEALFLAAILPTRKAGTLTRQQVGRLVKAIRAILARAIESGGTTLRDFIGGDGKPGYFKQSLLVYGRAGEMCTKCDTTLIEIRQGQRSTVYCKVCQR